MRTFDRTGRLLGDDSLTPDFQSFVDEASGTTASDTLSPITVTAQAIPGFSLATLLQPPGIYFLAGGLALLAYLYSREHAR
jgi:hypothetical protein